MFPRDTPSAIRECTTPGCILRFADVFVQPFIRAPSASGCAKPVDMLFETESAFDQFSLAGRGAIVENPRLVPANRFRGQVANAETFGTPCRMAVGPAR